MRWWLPAGVLLGVCAGIAWRAGLSSDATKALPAAGLPSRTQEPRVLAPAAAPASALPPAEFVGSQVCARCHSQQHTAWERSQHARAMQHARPDTVLGNFAGARLVYAGKTHRFEHDQGKYWVTTDGADGKLQRFEVRYTFGIEPLQQYLVEAPGGRLQALPFAWDSRLKSKGGQRWYHLNANENVQAGDVLHWTAPSHNWNHMCSECHSTRVRKNYAAASDHFETTWSELSVGCEGCHGGGARHVAWTEQRPADPSKGLDVRFDERGSSETTLLPSGTLQRKKATSSGVEAATCAFCHSRRESLAQPLRHGAPLLASVSPELLTDPSYTADGLMNDEVFSYGSFVQSKMAHAGVTCSDCHEPHSGRPRADGNALCTQCHDRSRFDSPGHHRHPSTASGGNRCVDCHMPSRTYMGNDVRHDHGFRVPRPDLSVKHGTPNACNDCHANQSSEWASQNVERWLGRPAQGFQRYAEVFARARIDAATVAEELRALAQDTNAPNIARATALTHLRSPPQPASLAVITAALRDADPLLRRAALTALEGHPVQATVRAAGPLLTDPVLGVRVEAARILAGTPDDALVGAPARALQHALDDYVATQTLNADRPEAQNNLGLSLGRSGNATAAEAAYLAALRLEPGYLPTYVNLADLYRSLARDDDGIALLRRGLARSPDAAELLHSLGLALVRKGNQADALEPLKRAALLSPGNARFQLVYEAAHGAAKPSGPARAVTRP